jgi:dCMP deaminase
MTSSKRPPWDEFFFLLALMYSTRGTCDRLRTATLIVKNKRFVGAGYNGSPPGAPHCDDVDHLIIEGHCERTLHGEENAINNTSREDLRGATAYILGTPCFRCAKLLISAGVKKINVLGTYENSRGKSLLDDLCDQTGVSIVEHDMDPMKLINGAVERLSDKGGALYNKRN